MAAQLNMRMWSIILDTFTMDGCSIKHEDVVYYSRPPSPWMGSIKHEDVVYYSRPFTMDGRSIKHEDVVYYSRPPSPWMAAQLNMRMWSIILDPFTMDGRSIKHEDVVYYSRHLHHGWLLN